MNQVSTKYMQCPCCGHKCVVHKFEVVRGELDIMHHSRMCAKCKYSTIKKIDEDNNHLWAAWEKEAKYFSIKDQNILMDKINTLSVKDFMKGGHDEI